MVFPVLGRQGVSDLLERAGDHRLQLVSFMVSANETLGKGPEVVGGINHLRRRQCVRFFLVWFANERGVDRIDSRIVDREPL